MEKCSISAERSLVSLNMTCSPSLVSLTMTCGPYFQDQTYSYLMHAEIGF